MAAAAGGPAQNDPKPKKELTDEQRKLYTQLGVIGVLAVIAGAIYLPGMFSGGSNSSSVPPAPITDNSVTAPPSEGGPPPAGAPGGPNVPPEGSPDAAAPAAASAGAVTLSMPFKQSRPDPFVKLYVIPTPAPPPPPIPPPVSVPIPPEAVPISLPGIPGGSEALRQPLVLPPVRITRLDEARRIPTDAFPPRRTVGAAAGGTGTINPSYDKRLSGVIIGDGVRAILEIRTGAAGGANGTDTGVVTHVVQPGDEVDGITILNIQRYNDGAKTVTRMIIRENGEERSVDLRPSPQPAGGGPTGAPVGP